jgi:hypothetical protein
MEAETGSQSSVPSGNASAANPQQAVQQSPSDSRREEGPRPERAGPASPSCGNEAAAAAKHRDFVPSGEDHWVSVPSIYQAPSSRDV